MQISPLSTSALNPSTVGLDTANGALQPGRAIALYQAASPTFDAKVAQTHALLLDAVQRFTPLVQAHSLGAEDMVLSHLIAQVQLPIPAFVLETGRLPAATLDLLALVQEQMGDNLQVYRPDEKAQAQLDQTHGPDLMYKSMDLRKACCQVRKLEPLERALAGKKAWLTGLRREQSGHRAEVPFIDQTDVPRNGRIKVNPLAEWTWGDIWHYIALHQVPYNRLHDQFYPSIGCDPCSRAISVGEDFRSGRWWWESSEQKECGLHSHSSQPISIQRKPA